ncbi:MAG: hypothetical protein LBT89_10395 [Planctomycetaceae bacterium]|jgi:hypothetical protein|nr:hypothetical protein [Planctomycetaceae bacterium]
MKHLVTITLLLLFAAAGCGTNGLTGLYKVNGKITLQGQPIDDVVVTFKPIEVDPAKRPAGGRSMADGTFVISTLKPNDGAYPGKYKVLVGKFVVNKAQTMSSDTVPMKYRNVDTTPIEYEVKAGNNAFLTIDIDEPLLEPVFPREREREK